MIRVGAVKPLLPIEKRLRKVAAIQKAAKRLLSVGRKFKYYIFTYITIIINRASHLLLIFHHFFVLVLTVSFNTFL